MLKLSIAFVASFVLMSNVSHASEQLLNRFFQEVQSLQADFNQQVVDETGMTLEKSSGVFYLSRPGKFRWNYHSLDPEYSELGQQIIADGQYIHMYDPGLEQVTQRSMGDALSQVPSLVLVQSGSRVGDYFTISDFGLTDGLSWVALKPKAEEASYQQLMIGFVGNSLRSIILLDGLGNETRLQLSKIENNVELAKEVFEFEAPPGVDVLAE